MFRNIDRSKRLSRLLDEVSNFTAQKRGLPIIAGVVFILISFVLQAVGVYADARLIDLLGVISLHVGVLTALIGILLVAPLGK